MHDNLLLDLIIQMLGCMIFHEFCSANPVAVWQERANFSIMVDLRRKIQRDGEI